MNIHAFGFNKSSNPLNRQALARPKASFSKKCAFGFVLALLAAGVVFVVGALYKSSPFMAGMALVLLLLLVPLALLLAFGESFSR